MGNKIDWYQWAKNVSGSNPVPDVINYFIKRYNYKSYLELGLLSGHTYNQIKCNSKESVDNNAKINVTYKTTTDDFFDNLADDKKWDVIFIDANHDKEYVLRDIYASLKHLTDGGIIFTHDVNPFLELQLKSRYCYNAWEAFVYLRQTREDLTMYTFPFGMLGLIQVGSQTLWTDKVDWTWEYLKKNRKDLVQELTEKEFYDLFGE